MIGLDWMPDPLTGALSAEDRWVMEHSGYGKPQGLADRPVLMVIDATYGFVGLDNDFRRSLEVYPAGVGQAAWQAVSCIQRLLDAFRGLGFPVVFTRPKRTADLPGSVRRGKRDRTVTKRGSNEIIDELAPIARELQIEKPAPSAFFQTGLSDFIEENQAGGVVLTGFTTSGCVRASAVDAFSRGLMVTVPTDAVADRLSLSHWVSLLDINFKYGDVITTEEVLHRLGAPVG